MKEKNCHRFVLVLALLLLLPSCRETVPTEEVSPLRLLSYNVWYGFTIQPDRKAAWLDWMNAQSPDIVVLQELNEYTPAQLEADAAAWGHAHSALLKTEGFPTGITSRYPIEDLERFLEEFHHGLMRARIGDVYVYVVHLHPSNWQTRIRETELLLADAFSLPEGSHVILAGDFNTFSPNDRTHYAEQTALEPFFAARDEQFGEQNLRNGRLDFTPLEMLQDAGFVDLIAEDRTKFQGTFPTLIEKEGEHGDLRRLDYVFADQNTADDCKDARVIADSTTAVLSDHYPVIADFVFD